MLVGDTSIRIAPQYNGTEASGLMNHAYPNIKDKPVAIDVDVTLTRCTSRVVADLVPIWGDRSIEQQINQFEVKGLPPNCPRSLAGPTRRSETSKDVLLTF